MIGKLRKLLSGEGVKARAARSSGWAMVEIVGKNFLKFASSMILTRLLFPEAFGLMAVVQVFITALEMFSDVGIRTSIVQNKRADEPDFLNTAWTMQVIRGVILFLATCAVSIPVANIYDEPLLAQLLPVAGITALIRAFRPTKVFSANRHLMIGNVIVLNLVAQATGIALSAILAWWLQSVWALVFGALLGAVNGQLLMRYLLPGIRNQFRWDWKVARELFHFGKYIFLGTAFSFVVNHADRAILGAFISFELLGIYTIGTLFAMLPFGIAQTLTFRVVMPLYRMRPPAESEANRRNIFRVRRLMIGGALAGSAILGFLSMFLVDTFYDERYALAGAIAVLVSVVNVPRIVFIGAGAVLLVNGDSKRNLILTGSLAIAQTIAFLLGAWQFGLVGVIFAPAIALLVTTPIRARYARLYESWDWKGEAVFLVLGLAVGMATCWFHSERLATLFQ